KAVIPPRCPPLCSSRPRALLVPPPRSAPAPAPRPPPLGGTRAMTTSRSATTPLVVHSLTPSSTYSDPSADGVAVVLSRAGSAPAEGGARRKARLPPGGHRGR